MTIPQGGEPPPVRAGATLSVLIKDVLVEGGMPEFAAQKDAMIAKLAGRRATVGEIYAAVAELEAAYASAGYFLVRVSVPPQRLKDKGDLRLLIVSGFVESVDVSGLPERIRQPVSAKLAAVMRRPDVRFSEVERALLLAGDTPGAQIRTTLARGVEEGGTRLIIEGDAKLWSVNINGDNRLTDPLGRYQNATSIAVNSPIGYGGQLYVSSGLSRNPFKTLADKGPFRMIAVGGAIPVPGTDVTFNPEVTSSATDQVNGGLSYQGLFRRYSLRFEYPIIRSRDFNLTAKSSLEQVHQKQKGASQNEDDYRVARGELFAAMPDVFGAYAETRIKLTNSLGWEDSKVSRFGADPHFSKAATSLRVIRPMIEGLRGDLIVSGQYAFNQAMPSSETFSLDGADAISAYPSGTFSVDSGFAARFEVSRLFNISLDFASSDVSPYVFASGGYGVNTIPSSLETKGVNASAIGAGVRSAFSLPNTQAQASLGFEIARGWSNQADRREVWRGSLSASLSF